MENGTKGRWVQPDFTHMCSADVECRSPPAHKQGSACGLDDGICFGQKKKKNKQF